MLLHTKLRRWLQPGGHADGDTELAGVALREATEETGIVGLRVLVPAVDLDLHEVDHGDALGTHLHLDLRFVVVAPGGCGDRGQPRVARAAVGHAGASSRSSRTKPGLVRLARAGPRAAGTPAAGPQLRSAGVVQESIRFTWAKLLIARVMPLVSLPLVDSRNRASSSTRRFST